MSDTIIIGNDHGAVELKEIVKKHLTNKGFNVKDLGTHDDESVDYPDKAEELCKEYLGGDYKFGIIMCGTGIGISISANKINGIRCALPQNLFAAKMSKLHNNAMELHSQLDINIAHRPHTVSFRASASLAVKKKG